MKRVFIGAAQAIGEIVGALFAGLLSLAVLAITATLLVAAIAKAVSGN
jgi:hypothetical protein